jgi:hypothetical protein
MATAREPTAREPEPTARDRRMKRDARQCRVAVHAAPGLPALLLGPRLPGQHQGRRHLADQGQGLVVVPGP